MHHGNLRRISTLIAMAACLPFVIGGAGVLVLCHGSDGHVAIEIAHAGHCCSRAEGCPDQTRRPDPGDGSAGIVGRGRHDGCSDTSIPSSGPMLASDSKRFEKIDMPVDALVPERGRGGEGCCCSGSSAGPAERPPGALASLTCLGAVLIRI
ncbi:MAG: hypothetical protein PHQ19_10405 [Candidatus Krumholzibacteria bacterium]|nr:hypothetical protein [Candidatus Krumholzibacteria bacterium]